MQEPCKIAVVGYGLIGQRHVDMILKTPETTLCAIVEPKPNSKEIAQKHGVPVYARLEEMLEHENPEGVILATPTSSHLEQSLQCVAKKIAVLVEKPIALNTSEAKVLNEKAQGANVPILVGHHRRHNGMVKAAKAAINSGEIGDIRAVQTTCWFYKPDDYFEIAPWRKHKGAGPISVNLVHDVDLLRYFCGEVALVQAMSAPSKRGYENEDLASALLKFESGAIATISVSDSTVSPWSWELTTGENPAYPATAESCYLIGGSEGGLSLPDLRIWKHQDRPDWWKPISAQNLICTKEDPLAAQMRHFAHVIKGKEQPLVSGIEAMKSLAVIEAIEHAARDGSSIDPRYFYAG